MRFSNFLSFVDETHYIAEKTGQSVGLFGPRAEAVVRESGGDGRSRGGKAGRDSPRGRPFPAFHLSDSVRVLQRRAQCRRLRRLPQFGGGRQTYVDPQLLVVFPLPRQWSHRRKLHGGRQVQHLPGSSLVGSARTAAFQIFDVRSLSSSSVFASQRRHCVNNVASLGLVRPCSVDAAHLTPCCAAPL